MVPKVSAAADLAEVLEAELRVVEKEAGLPEGKHLLLPIATETAEGVLNLGAIAKASSRVCAVT